MSDIGNMIEIQMTKDIQRILLVGGGFLTVAILLAVFLWPHQPMIEPKVSTPVVAEHPTPVVEPTSIVVAVEEPKISAPVVEKTEPTIMDDELAFYDNLITAKDHSQLDRLYSNTVEASPRVYASLDDMITHEVPLFLKGVDRGMNDSDTPGILTEWEAQWVWALYNAREGYEAKQKMQERRIKFKRKFMKND